MSAFLLPLLLVGAWTIQPGQSIGRIRLGMLDSTVTKILGKSSYGDAAMGHYWATWKGDRGNVVDVYSERGNGREGVVKLVRATSSRFRTPQGVGPGSPEATVRRADARLRRTASYRVSGGPPILLFDDVRGGVAYEFQRGRCVAATVHPKGHGVNDWYGRPTVYLAGRPYLEKASASHGD